MRLLILVCSALLCSVFLNAQNLDSLKHSLKNVDDDSTRIETYLAIHDILKLSDFSTASKYIDSAYVTAKNINWKLCVATRGLREEIGLFNQEMTCFIKSASIWFS